MKRTWFEKLGDFVLGKGFYIVLFLCVATIGISGYYLIHSVTNDPEQQLEPVTGNPTITLPDESAAVPVKPVLPVQPEPEPDDPPARAQTATQTPQAEPSPSEQPAPEPAKAPAVYTWPVKGEILRGYSLEVLAYDETMGDWRTHSGIDIAADVGIKVLCTSDGTVQAVYQDDLMGSTVVVDHGDGLTSAYSNLSDNPAVTVGQEVETGTVLGTVGSTAIAESASASHLHLEMTKDGTAVDPVNYLPK